MKLTRTENVKQYSPGLLVCPKPNPPATGAAAEGTGFGGAGDVFAPNEKVGAAATSFASAAVDLFELTAPADGAAAVDAGSNENPPILGGDATDVLEKTGPAVVIGAVAAATVGAPSETLVAELVVAVDVEIREAVPALGLSFCGAIVCTLG